MRNRAHMSGLRGLLNNPAPPRIIVIMTNPKIIFLDIDGPMIPVRAYYMLNQTKPLVTVFDPCAVSLLLRLLEDANAKLVISSTWGVKGRDAVVQVLAANGIDETFLHEDWITPRKLSSYRCHEIRWWLDNHPEVSHYVAIEDEYLPPEFVRNAVKCDTYEGFSWRNYLECRMYLEIGMSEAGHTIAGLINWHKCSEIMRTAGRDPGDHSKMGTLAEQLYPVLKQAENDDESN